MYLTIIIGITVILDQIVKFVITKNIINHTNVEVIKNLLYITYVENTGISFGLFKGNRYLFIILTLIVCSIISFYIIKLHKTNRLEYVPLNICLAFILGGAIGNLIDRIRLGYVVDYIHFTFFPPVFNLADSAIVCGAIVLSGILLFNKNINI